MATNRDDLLICTSAQKMGHYQKETNSGTSMRRRMVSSGLLRRVALVRTDVSEELSASIRVTRISELGTTLAVTSN
jgi:hypothetical protein